MPRVAIIDYGVGNLRSVEKAFVATGCDAVVSSDREVLEQAERLVLPGVGAFATCMSELSKRGFDELVLRRARPSFVARTRACFQNRFAGAACRLESGSPQTAARVV